MTVTANDSARYVFISSFLFLSAFLLRDMFMRLWDRLVDTKKLSFWKVVLSQILLFAIVFAMTLTAAIFWPNNGTTVI